MMPLALFSSSTSVGLTLLTLLLYGALSGMFVLIPYVLIEAASYSGTQAGAAILPLPAVLALTSPLMGGLAGRIGPRLPLAIGPVVVAAGFALLLRVDQHGGYWTTIFPAILLIAVGGLIGYMGPTTWLRMKIKGNQRALTYGLPDALDLKTGYLEQKFAKTKTPVKTVLMDQKVVRGIGNAYADEILWHARLSPFSPSNKIPDDKVKELAKSIKEVLEDAEKQILKANPDIISGEVRDFMIVHQPRKKETPNGVPINQKELSSRKTYYTDEQELFE